MSAEKLVFPRGFAATSSVQPSGLLKNQGPAMALLQKECALMSENGPRNEQRIGEGHRPSPDNREITHEILRRNPEYISPRGQLEQAQREAGNPVEKQIEAERIAREEANYRRGFPVAGHDPRINLTTKSRSNARPGKNGRTGTKQPRNQESALSPATNWTAAF
jgi:hypothetical protein